MATETFFAEPPSPAPVRGVVAPYWREIPYSKWYVVAAPFGFTRPLSVTVVVVLALTPPVVATGGPAAWAAAGAATVSATAPARAARPACLRDMDLLRPPLECCAC